MEGGQDDLEELLNAYSAEAERQNRKIIAKHGSTNKPKGQAAQREAGLRTSLGEDNVGHGILRKLGWREGESIGKGSGRVAPIELHLKTGRAGLGVDEARRRAQEAQQVHEEQERVKRARLAEESQQRYHAATRAGYASRQAARHLRGAWRVAEQLAEQQHQQQHQQERQPQRNEDQDVQQHQHRHQQRDHRQEQVQRVDLAHGGGGNRGGPATAALHVLLERLPTLQMMLQQEIPQQEMHASAGRRTDVKTAAEVEIADTTSALEPGCCGTAVAKPRQACSVDRALMDTEPEPSPADMSATGPATYGQVNGCAPRVVAEPTQPPATTDEKAEEAEAAVEPPSLGAQLELLLLHLRQVHCYCYFCGTAYDGPDDMASHCPGLTEEEH